MLSSLFNITACNSICIVADAAAMHLSISYPLVFKKIKIKNLWSSSFTPQSGHPAHLKCLILGSSKLKKKKERWDPKTFCQLAIPEILSI